LKILNNVTYWLFVSCLPALLISATVAFEFNSLRLYTGGFEKYHVSETTGLAQAELEKAARGLISYFNSDEEYISLTVEKDGQSFALFNEREIEHLKDVKALVQLNSHLLLGTAIYVGAYVGFSLFRQRRKQMRRLAWGVAIGSGISLGVILALGIGSMLNFDQLFTQFHFLAFTNELWMLDPSRDYLIMLFPPGFWFDAAVLLGQIVAGTAGTLGGVAGGYLWLARRRDRAQDTDKATA
jgi:integral membrane protein (TIGR01906 family)